MDKEIMLNAIEQIYAAACAQLERLPDHADRLASEYEISGADGVLIEMLRITKAQVQGVRSLANEMMINPRLRNGATEAGSTRSAGRGMLDAGPTP